jgi:hypothetical protein
MLDDPTIEELNSELKALMCELDATTTALVRALADFVEDLRPRHPAIVDARRASLSALKAEILALAAHSFKVARGQIGSDAGRAGIAAARRHALRIAEEGGGGTQSREAILWSEELDARWESYLDLLGRARACLEAIDLRLGDRLAQEGLLPDSLN